MLLLESLFMPQYSSAVILTKQALRTYEYIVFYLPKYRTRCNVHGLEGLERGVLSSCSRESFLISTHKVSSATSSV